MSDSNDLLAAATAVRNHAYAPHSGYQVGAAVRAANGKTYVGCNIENDTYGLTLCAERAAIAAMVSDGQTEVTEVVVVTEDAGSPCGLCRQTLVQFSQDPASVTVTCAGINGTKQVFVLDELLPHAFRLAKIGSL